jgi:hypothetical protein
MLRRFNYTGRQKINREHVPIALTGNEFIRSFDANLSALNMYEFPPDAQVFVEAYHQTAYMRFAFGTIGELAVPPAPARALNEFEGSDRVLFRVKVVDGTADSKLLGEADSILPLSNEETEDNKLPLLPVRTANLGQEIWKVEFQEGTQSRPILLINEKLGDHTPIVRSTHFMAFVWPAVLREIFRYILQIQPEEFDADNTEDWRTKWVQYGRSLLPTFDKPPDEPEAADSWISQIASAFAERHALTSRLKEAEEE